MLAAAQWSVHSDSDSLGHSTRIGIRLRWSCKVDRGRRTQQDAKSQMVNGNVKDGIIRYS